MVSKLIENGNGGERVLKIPEVEKIFEGQAAVKIDFRIQDTLLEYLTGKSLHCPFGETFVGWLPCLYSSCFKENYVSRDRFAHGKGLSAVADGCSFAFEAQLAAQKICNLFELCFDDEFRIFLTTLKDEKEQKRLVDLRVLNFLKKAHQIAGDSASTFSGTFVWKDCKDKLQMSVAHYGDSRIYLIDVGGKARKLTYDGSAFGNLDLIRDNLSGKVKSPENVQAQVRNELLACYFPEAQLRRLVQDEFAEMLIRTEDIAKMINEVRRNKGLIEVLGKAWKGNEGAVFAAICNKPRFLLGKNYWTQEVKSGDLIAILSDGAHENLCEDGKFRQSAEVEEIVRVFGENKFSLFESGISLAKFLLHQVANWRSKATKGSDDCTFVLRKIQDPRDKAPQNFKQTDFRKVVGLESAQESYALTLGKINFLEFVNDDFDMDCSRLAGEICRICASELGIDFRDEIKRIQNPIDMILLRASQLMDALSVNEEVLEVIKSGFTKILKRESFQSDLRIRLVGLSQLNAFLTFNEVNVSNRYIYLKLKEFGEACFKKLIQEIAYLSASRS
jgi:serine/threonine protein phosphatase PrpC